MNPTPLALSWSFRQSGQNAPNNAIAVLVPPRGTKRTKVNLLKYTCAATSHTLSVLQVLGKTTVVAPVASSATGMTLARDPGNYSGLAASMNQAVPSVANNSIGANDFVGIQLADKTWLLGFVAGAGSIASNGTINITLTGAVPTSVLAGAEVQFFGAPGDNSPLTGRIHPQYNTTINGTITLDGTGGTVAESYGLREGLVIHSNNTVNNGTFDQVNGFYGS